MVRLMWVVGLLVAVVSRAHGTGSKLKPVRLSVKSHNETNPQDDSTVPKSPDNSVVLKSADGQAHPAATAAGSLTCMRWTGGSCHVLACRESRSATCENGYCMCTSGTCATAEGKCAPYFKGKWIGEYSISFSKPSLPERSFLGTDDTGDASWVPGGIAWLATVSTSAKQWKIAQTPNGRVRLTNTRHPGSVLTIYNNRRRSRRRSHHHFLEVFREQKKMNDNDDLWPMLIKLEAATPLAATFQVRPTLQNGGGYELWDPENQVSLASGEGERDKGVTECYQKSFLLSDPCEGGKQLIAFDPALPNRAAVAVHRAHIVAISILTWWQSALMICCAVCCVCCFRPSSILIAAQRLAAGEALFEAVAVTGTRTYFKTPLTEGVNQFRDRSYTLTGIPSYLAVADLFQGPCSHQVGDTIAIKPSAAETAYILVSSGNPSAEITKLQELLSGSSGWAQVSEGMMSTNSFSTTGFEVFSKSTGNAIALTLNTHIEMSIAVGPQAESKASAKEEWAESSLPLPEEKQTQAFDEAGFAALAEKIAGFWVLESDIGNFEYELLTTSEGMNVHGREQGKVEWDSTYAGQLCTADNPIHLGQLRWEDNNGTKFSLVFEDETCSGMARAPSGQEVPFSGKRTEPSA